MLNSEYLGRDSRGKALSDARQRLIRQGQEEINLYSKVLSAINRDAEALGITPNEYVQVDVSEQSSSSQGTFLCVQLPNFLSLGIYTIEGYNSYSK